MEKNDIGIKPRVVKAKRKRHSSIFGFKCPLFLNRAENIDEAFLSQDFFGHILMLPLPRRFIGLLKRALCTLGKGASQFTVKKEERLYPFPVRHLHQEFESEDQCGAVLFDDTAFNFPPGFFCGLAFSRGMMQALKESFSREHSCIFSLWATKVKTLCTKLCLKTGKGGMEFRCRQLLNGMGVVGKIS